jgi:hypothetical protein
MSLEQIIISALSGSLVLISSLVIYIWNSTLKTNYDKWTEVNQNLLTQDSKLEKINQAHVQINLKLADLASEMKVVHKDNSRLEIIMDKQNVIVNNMDKRLIKMEEWKHFSEKIALRDE